VREAALFAVRGSNVRCQFEFPDDLWPAHVDAGQIGQVIHNLVINADQVMPEGGIIAISGNNTDVEPDGHFKLPPGQYIRIMIQDQETGIKKEHLNRIYDPYFTTKQKGSGLGLTIVYSIIEKHEGQVSVYSELGMGTTFNIYLPASPGNEVRTETSEETLTSGSGRILVMDDEKFIRSLASEMLRKMGYKTVSAKDGTEAIKMYRHAIESDQPFDAVILDLTVPGGMGGQETMARLTEIDKDVKVIVSRGYSNNPVISKYRDGGFFAVVRKPYVIKELSDALKKLEFLRTTDPDIEGWNLSD
jgi:CheY-like chemotaxis protein